MLDFQNIKRKLLPAGFYHLAGNVFFDLKKLKKCIIQPKLFVVGAQKCGTSSLHKYLDTHPDIFMSKPLKEPGYHVPWPIIHNYYNKKNKFFASRGDLLNRGMLRGYNSEKWFGESSTFYSNGSYNIPASSFLNDGMDLKEVRIIYLIRNPFDRIRSHYLHARRNNGFEGDINKFVRENPEALLISQFGLQLSHYFKYLEQSQILILEFEALVKSPQSTMDKVYQFLNIPARVHEEFLIFNAAPYEQKVELDSMAYSSETCQMITMAIDEDGDRLRKFTELPSQPWTFNGHI